MDENYSSCCERREVPIDIYETYVRFEHELRLYCYGERGANLDLEQNRLLSPAELFEHLRSLGRSRTDKLLGEWEAGFSRWLRLADGKVERLLRKWEEWGAPEKLCAAIEKQHRAMVEAVRRYESGELR